MENQEKPTVLITGVNGFIGRHLVKELEKQFKCIGIDVQPSAFDKIDKYYSVDLLNDNGLKKIFLENDTIKYCVHCAGSASVPFSVDFPFKDFLSNTLITHKLLDSIRETGVKLKFIFLSSAAVYGNPVSLPVTENFVESPISPYGYNKYYAELAIKQYSYLYNIDFVIVRIFSAFGEGLKKQIMWDLCTKFKSDETIELWGDGSETRDFIYITDITNAILHLITCETAVNQVYNLGSGTEITIKFLADSILSEFESTKEIKFNNKVNIGNPVKWCADISKIKNTGWLPKTNLNAGIKKYVRWFNNQ